MVCKVLENDIIRAKRTKEGESMLWSEVRELFPDQFVLVEELKSHYEDDKLHVEEVAVIRPIQDLSLIHI